MKTVRPVKSLNSDLLLQLNGYAKSEFGKDAGAFKRLESCSLGLWEIWNEDKFLGYAGVAAEHFMSPPVFWLLAGDISKYSDMKIFKILSGNLHQAFPTVITFVEQGWNKGDAFARFCGFVPTSQGFTAFGVDYLKYVRGV